MAKDAPYTFTVATTRSELVGPASRPVFIPDDIDDTSVPKATGRVQLPLHIRWSEPLPEYDLEDRVDRARVYEQVLREGTEDDVRYYVRLQDLLDLWNELVLPEYVRKAWSGWLRVRGLRVGC